MRGPPAVRRNREFGPWALFAEQAPGAFLPNLVAYLPFTAGEQLCAVTTRENLSMQVWAQRCS